MKLLFFASTLKGGGAERVLANLTNELVRKGHSITISLNDNAAYYELDQRIRIVSPHLHIRYGGKCFFRRLINRFAQKRLYFSHTRNVINTSPADVIITFMHCNMWPIVLFHGKIPIIHSEHNAYDRSLGFSWHFRRFFLNRFFNCVFVLTPFDQGYAKAKGLNNTVVMPNPNSFDTMRIAEYNQSFSSRKNVLACGRINSWFIKGFDIAIEAFAKISNLYPNVDLDIVGDGDEEAFNHLNQFAIDHGVKQRVHFLGHQNNIQAIMRQHKLFILSSRTEGFPMVVTEAMSQGLPCIAFEKLASSIIVDGIDGVLVQDLDVLKLAETVSVLLSDNDKRYSLGLQAINNVERFSSDIVAKRWESVLRPLSLN